MESQKELTQAKIDVRYHSRELIKVVFIVTEDFPARDIDGIGPILRKKCWEFPLFYRMAP